ncbi:MAG: alpha/beta hydrolase [Planctomycetota bacterium]|nr:alpha/beta hydrolase [Planctomycetota bacterium]
MFRYLLQAITIIGLQCLALIGWAQEPQVERLWPDGAPGALGQEEKDRPTLICYPASPETSNGTAVVICPGGGYGHLAMEHEGHEVARWLNENGISAFICDYRHRNKGYGHPAPLQDVQRAIAIVRSRSEPWNIRKNQIGVLGFSAGGHLASTAATHFEQGDPQAADPVDRVSTRPDFAVLCYPVIAFGEPFTHRGSQRNLLGKNPDAKLLKSLSNEKQVSPQTPPCFLWHTTADTGVLPENSIRFYQALVENGVPAELHLYEKGRHGLGLAKNVPGASNWPDELIEWLGHHGWLNPPEKRAARKTTGVPSAGNPDGASKD